MKNVNTLGNNEQLQSFPKLEFNFIEQTIGIKSLPEIRIKGNDFILSVPNTDQ